MKDEILIYAALIANSMGHSAAETVVEDRRLPMRPAMYILSSKRNFTAVAWLDQLRASQQKRFMYHLWCQFESRQRSCIHYTSWPLAKDSDTSHDESRYKLTRLISVISRDIGKVQRKLYVRESFRRYSPMTQIPRGDFPVRLQIIHRAVEMVESEREEVGSCMDL